MSTKGTAIVTGAAQGIGRAIALRLASDGYDVAVNDVSSKKEALDSLVTEITDKGRKSIVVIANVSVEDEMKGMVDKVVKDFGGLDVMIANAGIASACPLLQMTVEEMDRVYAVNVRGTFLCYKYAGIQMVAQGRGGRIVGASSVSGKQGDALGSAYCASKFAIRALTQSAASELGRYKITVNAYAPGAVLTPLLEDVEDRCIKMGVMQKRGDLTNFTMQRNVVGYNGTPEDVANVVSFLVSKDSHFITGQAIGCDGGRHFD